MERWLPVLGVVVGLSLMAMAMVAEGQPIPEQAAPPATPAPPQPGAN